MRRRGPRAVVSLAAVSVATLTVLAACDRTPSTPESAGSPTGSATTVPTSSGGPVIPRGALGRVEPGDCTGELVDSPPGTDPDLRLALTAAHCLIGPADGWTLHVDPEQGGEELDVVGAYVDPEWPDRHDLAVLAVRMPGGRPADPSVSAGAVGAARARAGDTVHVAGYAANADVRLDCDTVVRDDTGPVTGPVVDCPGFAPGTSGSPWVSTDAAGERHVVGIVGGPEAGGCTDDISRTPAFGAWTEALVRRAAADGTSDDVPEGGGDDCG